jgi:purine-binding chemotaxis protein CheW
MAYDSAAVAVCFGGPISWSPFPVTSMICHDNSQHILFSLDDERYAVPVGMVERVVRAVQITRLPEAPAWVEGIITVNGRIIPVVSLRQRFHLPSRPLQLSDRIMICRTVQRTLAFTIDQVHEVVSLPPEMRDEAAAIFPQLEEYIVGASRLADDTVLIYDLDRLLNPAEIASLDSVLAEQDEAHS